MSHRLAKATRIALAAAIALGGAVSTAALTAPAAHAAGTSVPGGQITRSEVMARALSWVGKTINYSGVGLYPDPQGVTYRTDCSGFVSMAWHTAATGLNAPATQAIGDSYTVEIDRSQMKPGDVLNDHDHHAILFEKWEDAAHTVFSYYSFGSGTAVKHGEHVSINALIFDSHPNGEYLALRYKNIVDDPTTPNTVHLVNLTPAGGLSNIEGDYNPGGGWKNGWNDMGAADIKEVTSAATGSTNRVFAIGSDNRVYEKDGDYTTGQWSGWFIPEKMDDGKRFTAISASSLGNTLHLVAIGTDGQLWNNDGTFPNGGWTGWSSHDGATNLKRVSSATTTDGTNHIFVVRADNQVDELDAYYATSKWGTWAPAGNSPVTAKDVAASAWGNTVHLDRIGMDGQLWNTEGNYDAWHWDDWKNMGGGNFNLKRIASATSKATNVNHIFGVTGDNHLVEIDADYTTVSWNNWAPAAGGTDSIGVTASFTS